MKGIDLVCVALDERNQWCADLLDPHTAGTCWLALEVWGPALPDLFVALQRAAFVFEGRARAFAIRDVTGARSGGRYGIETARTLDELIEAPGWIRSAVALELRARRESVT